MCIRDSPPADLQAVVVHKNGQVIQPELCRGGRGFPVRALRQFPVSGNRVYTAASVIRLRRHGHSGGYGHSMAQSPGIGLYAWQLMHIRLSLIHI